MGRIVVTEFVSLDGVMEDPGGSEHSKHGAWTFKFSRGEEGDKFKIDETLNAQAQLTLNPGTYYMDTLSSSSQSAITITGPTVIYISNLLSVGAGGFVNTTTDPKSLVIYDKGTAAATVWAASHFYGLVYAPNAAVSIGGGGDVFGSLVGQNISMQGNGSVHYDDTLSNFLTTAEPFRIVEWRRGNSN